MSLTVMWGITTSTSYYLGRLHLVLSGVSAACGLPVDLVTAHRADTGDRGLCPECCMAVINTMDLAELLRPPAQLPSFEPPRNRIFGEP
jgi:hypothetical protein